MPSFEGEISAEGKTYKIKGEFKMETNSQIADRTGTSLLVDGKVDRAAIEAMLIKKTGKAEPATINEVEKLLGKLEIKVDENRRIQTRESIAEFLDIIDKSGKTLYRESILKPK